MVIGLPDRGWFRLLLVSIAGAWIVLYASIWLGVRWWRPQDRPLTSRFVRAVGRVVTEVGRGAVRLATPAVLRPLATTVASLAIYAVVMWLVLDALGLGAIGFGAAVSAVVIISLANVLLPIPVELGVTEVTGVGILGAFGVDARDAAIVMLGYRVVTTGALTIVVLAVMATLRGAFTPREAAAA
jgi:uncharacterized membrane protein YbhN (UPF0104 family)